VVIVLGVVVVAGSMAEPVAPAAGGVVVVMPAAPDVGAGLDAVGCAGVVMGVAPAGGVAPVA
jgi:hypothetical protein